MRVRGLRLAASALVAAAALLAATGAATAAPVSKRAAADAGAITLGVPGIPPVFLAVRPYVALQKGFYKKYGVDVTIKPFTTGTDAMRAVINGQIDAAWAPTPTALAAIANGSPLVGIYGMDIVDWEIGSTDPAIKTCSDLKGQTIGVDTVGGARYNALVGMLTKCGLKIDDVKTVNFPGAAATNAQISGQLKVAVEHVDDVAQVEASTGKQVTVVEKLTDVDPYQHYDMLVATRSGVKAHYFDFVHMLEGSLAATAWMNDPKNLDAATDVGTVTGESSAVVKSALQHYLQIGWWPYKNSGLTIQRITRTIGLNVKAGVIPASAHLTWKDVVDTRMWKQANAALNHLKPKKHKK